MVVIVGGGFAGLEAAIQIRALRPAVSVTLISPTAHLLYKPWLIYVPAGRKSLSNLQIPLSPLAARHGFELIEDRVAQIDLDGQRVSLQGGGAIAYSELVLAMGAAVDREVITGGPAHGHFLCQPDDTDRFSNALRETSPRSVCIAIGWDRPGPGLEFAGWLAASRKQLGLRELSVNVVDGDGSLAEHYGAEPLEAVYGTLTKCGATVLPEVGITEVTATGAVIGGQSIPFDLVAIVSPLRGVDVGLSAGMLDDRGFVLVSGCFETERLGVFGFGDTAALPSEFAAGRTMASIRERVGRLAANVIARIEGHQLTPLETATGPRSAMPDIGGRTVVMKDKKVIGRGRLPLLQRFLYDRSYFLQRHS